MRRVDPPRPRRRGRQAWQRHERLARDGRRQRRERTLLAGLGLVAVLLMLAWFDVGSATPLPARVMAGGPR